MSGIETNSLHIETAQQDDLINGSMLDEIFDIPFDIERERAIISVEERAKEIGCYDQVKRLISVYRKELRKLHAENSRINAQKKAVLQFERDGQGRPTNAINNFLEVFRKDERFASLRYNSLLNSPEKTVNGQTLRWTDADDASARAYIEKKYKIHSVQKFDDAMRIIFSERAYNPAIDLVNSIEWDGQPRIRTMLSKWMKCEDSPYTQEVSRLIFAGGIHRLFNPGCKFDDVPVLIGTRQGEGKSTFVRWLAMDDTFFTEVTEIDGQKGMESIEGAWICEMGELLALTRAKDVESVKSFMTRQVDRYRKPYDKRTSDYKRQCIFIGTTNRQQFLTDKTGNRRFYPVNVGQSGYAMFEHESEVKADIRQCWAEAKALYDRGELEPFADQSLVKEIRERQADAVEDDYRVGMIEAYLENKNEVCIFELWEKALQNSNGFSKPTRKDSSEIVLLMQNFPEWVKSSKARRTKDYGVQKCWVREGISPVNDELPL